MLAAWSGAVALSRAYSQARACAASGPHMSSSGRRLTHTAGRSGRPYRRQRLSGVSWTQRTPLGLPSGMPGMGEEIDAAMQQAPQPIRHSICFAPMTEYCTHRGRRRPIFPSFGRSDLYSGLGRGRGQPQRRSKMASSGCQRAQAPLPWAASQQAHTSRTRCAAG